MPPTPPTPPTANELRRLVEGLDGTRGEDLFLALKDGRLVLETNRPESGAFFIVRTEFSGGDGLRGTETLSVTNRDIPITADAAFTTQSAFEKFVLPYYVRTRTPKELQAMKDTAYQDDVGAVFHEPSSETGTTLGLSVVKKNGDIEPISLLPLV